MNRDRIYLVLGSLGLLALALFILFLPGSGDEKKGGRLWNREWRIIDYYPDGVGKDRSSIRMVRKGGVFEPNLFFVEASFRNGDRKGGELPLRQAGGLVSNLFVNWSSPALKGAYKAAGVPPETSGLTDQSPALVFFSGEGGSPVTVTLGKSAGSGSLFISVSEKGVSDRIFVISRSLISALDGDPLRYRERRIFIFPTQSAIRGIEAKRPGREDVVLSMETKKDKGIPVPIWSLGGTVIPGAPVRALEAELKSVVVRYFRDDPALLSMDAEGLWKKAGQDDLRVRLLLTVGGPLSFRVRIPSVPVVHAGVPLYLIQGESGEVDFVNGNTVDHILKKINGIKGGP